MTEKSPSVRAGFNQRILITGGTGLLGKALFESYPGEGPLALTYHRNRPPVEWSDRFLHLDVTEERSLHRVFDQVRPQIVIHTASIGNVDEAEEHPEEVRQVNVEAVAQVVEACRRHGAFLVYISSNAVFDGRHPPYSEDSPPNAANRYGIFKIEAERLVRTGAVEYLILRPILMYGWPLPGGRSNAVTRWLDHLEKQQEIPVAYDLYSMPLPVHQAAQIIWEALRRKTQGILHAAGADRVRLVQFAQEVAEVFGHEKRLVIPVSHAQLHLPAHRPPDTSFVTDRMERELEIHPISIREGLAWMQRSRAAVP